MILKRIAFTFFLFILLFLSATVYAKGVQAQVLKFQLANPGQTIVPGQPFQLNIMINSSGQQIMGADAMIIYDPTVLSISSTQNGGFFSSYSDSQIGGVNNKYLMSGWEISEAYAKSNTTDAVFATMNVILKSSASTPVKFDCTPGSTTDSNIWNTLQADIINCNGLSPITLAAGASNSTPAPSILPETGPTGTPSATIVPVPTDIPTATPVPPTATPVPPTNTPVPTIAQLPRTGTTEITVGAIGAGLVLTFAGLLFLL